jgi:hypothetical protein|tara:strand:- start:82 stop:987 length:906 start_codon:yes stop_codon:yes gene_type:complete
MAYRLEEFLPNEVDRNQLLDHTKNSNQGLLTTVLECVSRDVKALKNTAEMFADRDLIDVQKLQDVSREMHIMSDTLAMIGLGEQCQIVEAQIMTVKKIQNDALKLDYEKIRTVVLELIQVEQAIEKMQKLQPKVSAEQLSVEALSVFELDNVLDTIVFAMLGDIKAIKRAILKLVKDPSCRVSLELCTSLMTQLRGALLMLDKLRAVALMDTLLEYLNGYDTVELADVNKLDSLFQIVVSLTSYLEVLGESRTNGDMILDTADNQLSTFLVPVSTATKVSSSERFDFSVEKDLIEVDPTAH